MRYQRRNIRALNRQRSQPQRLDLFHLVMPPQQHGQVSNRFRDGNKPACRAPSPHKFENGVNIGIEMKRGVQPWPPCDKLIRRAVEGAVSA